MKENIETTNKPSQNILVESIYVLEKDYNSDNQLVSIKIRVQTGQLPITGKQFVEWRSLQYPKLDEIS